MRARYMKRQFMKDQNLKVWKLTVKAEYLETDLFSLSMTRLVSCGYIL